MSHTIKIGKDVIGNDHPVYFIADIAANHDGDIKRAKKLIELAKESGAHAVKFQHFEAKNYVSDFGFKKLGGKFGHQSKWEKSVYQVFEDAEVPLNWTAELKSFCDELDICFFTTPYDLRMIEELDEYVPAYKIGSGDVAWEAILKKVASKNKPVLVATGASELEEVIRAVDVVTNINKELVLMQCNTNYTGSKENFKYINLRVLETYRTLFPDLILGLSDHTPGHATVLGAVALGARVVEKHFTDDNNRVGPDHPFSMNPNTWREMVDQTELLTAALGDRIKKVEENEKETVILQRRSICIPGGANKGDSISKEIIGFQRPCPEDAIHPNEVDTILGKKLRKNVPAGGYLRIEDIVW